MRYFKHRAGLWAATHPPTPPAAPVKVREATPSGSAWGSFLWRPVAANPIQQLTRADSFRVRFESSVFDLNQIIMPPKSISSFPRRAEEKSHETRGFSPSSCCYTRHRVRDCFVIIRGLRVRWQLSALSSETVRGLRQCIRISAAALRHQLMD